MRLSFQFSGIKSPEPSTTQRHYHTLYISVAFQPFFRWHVASLRSAMWGQTGFTQLIFDVKSNCRDQLNDMVKLGRQERPNEGMNERKPLEDVLIKPVHCSTREAWPYCESFFFQAVWAIMPGALVDWGRNWTQKGVNFQLDQEVAWMTWAAIWSSWTYMQRRRRITSDYAVCMPAHKR